MKSNIQSLQADLGRPTTVFFGVRHFVKNFISEKRKNVSTLFLICVFKASVILSQSVVYENFEGKKLLNYGERTGVLDTVFQNPAPNEVNSSAKCALYIRNGSKKFDNIKMKFVRNLDDVKPYATYVGIPPKLKLKINTTAPVGTLVEILLGSKNRNNDYPAGTNSQYQAYTTVSGAWEELEFKFSQIPQGSEISTTQIDQITLLFSPNSSTSETYYFDDLTGPPLLPEPDDQLASPGKKKKNYPKPIKEQQVKR
jgi:hypothetical protein